MKFFVIISFFVASFAVRAQTIVDQFGYSSGFCTGTYFLYDDSSFAYERGCEGRSKITLGDYKLKNDVVYLYPKELNQLGLIKEVEFVNNDSSLVISTRLVARNDSMTWSNARYPDIEYADFWKRELIPDHSLKDDSSVKFLYEVVDSGHEFLKKYSSLDKCRTNSDSLAVCPIDLARLLGEKRYWVVPPNVNEVRIHLYLPYNILVFLSRYKMVYENLEPSEFTVDGRNVKIITNP
ncbi:MAG: hypothetical protein NXI10_11485 [bacterium]|nr:hypothetical protein [bacterium]